MTRGDWDSINWPEAWTVFGANVGIGMIRFLYLLRRGRKFVWFDVVLEPCLAVFAGFLVYGLMSVVETPGVLKIVMSNLAAWGGPRTIHKLELKYFGGSRSGDKTTSPGELF